MNISKVIYWLIMFVVGFVYFFIVKYIRLPHLRVFVYAFPPLIRVWNGVKGSLIQALGWVLMFFLIMYVLWKFIKKFIPNIPILPLRKILLRIPPLPQLERTGMFKLFDGVYNAIFSKSTKWDERAMKISQGLAGFLETYSTQLLSMLGLGYLAPSAPAKGEPLPPPPPSREEILQRNSSREPAAGHEKSEVRKVDEDFRQCMEENVVPIEPSMSSAELKALNAKNTLARTICKMKYLNSFTQMLSGKA